MIKRFVVACIFVAVAYGVVLNARLLNLKQQEHAALPVDTSAPPEEPTHKVYSFSFSKYTTDGEKELEIEGDSANMFSRNIALSNVIAKAYADNAPITITADAGMFDKATGLIHLEDNVVATTATGARLLTPALDIHPADKLLETDEQAHVKRDNITIDGKGARGDSQLKRVKFRKQVTVVIHNDDDSTQMPAVITCDGPLDIDYEQYIARFYENVVAKDYRGELAADRMDVFYDKAGGRVRKMIAVGNVIVTNLDGNVSYSDRAIYLVDQGRIILGGDSEAKYYFGTESVGSKDVDFLFGS